MITNPNILPGISQFNGCLIAYRNRSQQNIIEDTSKIEVPTVKDTRISDSEENIDKSTKFMYAECKAVVSLDEKFNKDIKNNQMCKLCTMTAEYGDK